MIITGIGNYVGMGRKEKKEKSDPKPVEVITEVVRIETVSGELKNIASDIPLLRVGSVTTTALPNIFRITSSTNSYLLLGPDKFFNGYHYDWNMSMDIKQETTQNIWIMIACNGSTKARLSPYQLSVSVESTWGITCTEYRGYTDRHVYKIQNNTYYNIVAKKRGNQIEFYIDGSLHYIYPLKWYEQNKDNDDALALMIGSNSPQMPDIAAFRGYIANFKYEIVTYK